MGERPIEWRGRQRRNDRVADYLNNRDPGNVHGPQAALSATFDEHLRLEARPE